MTGSTNITSWKRYLSLASRVRQKGVVWYFKMFLRMAYGKVHILTIPFITPIKQNIIFLINLFNLLSNKEPRKVILGVWDYKCIPWSVGDLLIFIETLSVLKIRYNAEKVDVCVVCDSENPAGNRGYKNIDSSNFRYYLFSLLPIINTSPYLGSVFQFDSRLEFFSFLKQNINKYEIYPPVNKQLKETFNFYGGATLKEIQKFYKERGFIPHLAIDDYHLGWAYNLCRTEAEGLLPVAVSLRNRPDSTGRNAEQSVWLEFFDLCKSKFPEVVFVVVGIREEASEDLRQRSNVIVAKDHGSTLADDFALVRTSLMYIGLTTGVSEIAIYSDVPYLIFGIVPDTVRNMGLELGYSKFEFATEHQKIFHASFVITPDSLLSEFSNLYNQLDVNQFRKKASAYKSPLYSYASWK